MNYKIHVLMIIKIIIMMITTRKTPSQEGIARSCGVTQSSRGTPAFHKEISHQHTPHLPRGQMRHQKTRDDFGERRGHPPVQHGHAVVSWNQRGQRGIFFFLIKHFFQSSWLLFLDNSNLLMGKNQTQVRDMQFLKGWFGVTVPVPHL